LIGDASKAKSILGWEPTTNLHQLVDIMVQNDMKIESLKS
jgi:GDP-D-mannose dehydratase